MPTDIELFFRGDHVDEEKANTESTQDVHDAYERSGDQSAEARDMEAQVQGFLDAAATTADVAAQIAATYFVTIEAAPALAVLALQLKAFAGLNKAGLLFKYPKIAPHAADEGFRRIEPRANEDGVSHAREHGVTISKPSDVFTMPPAQQLKLPKDPHLLLNKMRSPGSSVHALWMEASARGEVWLKRHRAMHEYYVRRMGPHFVEAFTAVGDKKTLARVVAAAVQHDAAALEQFLKAGR